MKNNLFTRRLSVSTFWKLTLATLGILNKTVTANIPQAFKMLDDEEKVPPYEVVNASNLTNYQLTSFNEVDVNGIITGTGVLAFTLYDMFYTKELLLCEEDDCCEARNYSHESTDTDDDYFPPCSMNQLLEILSQNCSMVPTNQTIPPDIFTRNLSSICS